MRGMRRSAGFVIFSVAVVAAAFSCETAEEMEGALGDGEDCAKIVGVYQASAGPGMMVRVETDREVFGEEGATHVEIGGLPAKIHRILDEKTAQVIVPLLDPGEAPVQIVEAGKQPCGDGRLNILPARAIRLFLSFADGQLDLLETQPGAGAARSNADEGGRRIQYEALNGLGRLVFRGVVNHPADGRHEVFDHDEEGERWLRMLPVVQQNALLAIMIPNVPGGATVRFFDLPENADGNTAEGRRLRSFMSEIHVEGVGG